MKTSNYCGEGVHVKKPERKSPATARELECHRVMLVLEWASIEERMKKKFFSLSLEETRKAVRRALSAQGKEGGAGEKQGGWPGRVNCSWAQSVKPSQLNQNGKGLTDTAVKKIRGALAIDVPTRGSRHGGPDDNKQSGLHFPFVSWVRGN